MLAPFSRSTLACAILACSLPAFANDTVQLQNTVVSASGFEQKITEAPASISVISQQDLQEKRYNSLAHALSDVEGIDVGQNTGKTGGLNISIRGMESKYTLILIDGRRQNAAGNVTPNGFGETSTSFIPPMSSIERIEVIRGPMSTLYGSDAMGGVINIITKKVATEWSGSVTQDYTFQEDRDYGDTRNTSVFASGPLIDGVLGAQVRGSLWKRDKSELSLAPGVDMSARGPAPVDGDRYYIGTRLDLTPHEDHDFSLDLDRAKQKYNNDECQLGTLDGFGSDCIATTTTSSTASGYTDTQRFNRDQIALTHTGRYVFGTWESSLMRNTTETIGRTIPGKIGTETKVPGAFGGDKRTLENINTILDSKVVMPIGDSHITTIGGQWWKAELEDGVAQTTFEQKTWAAFFEDEWRLRDDLALTLGARYDHHDAFGSHISPRAYLVWNTTDNWTLKGGVSTGYKTPDVNDLHSGINGAGAQGNAVTIGNPDLQPEESTNTEFGIYFDNLSGFNANATLFHNKFKDKIVDGPLVLDLLCQDNKDTRGRSNPGCTPKINVGKAETQGLELAASWHFAPAWTLSGNYTYTDSEQKSGEDKGAPLTNTPKHLANAKLKWQATDHLDMWLIGEYRGDRARFTSRYNSLANADGSYSTNQSLWDTLGKDAKAYSLIHLGASLRATEDLTFNATIYNLLDKDFTKGKAYTTYSTPTYNQQGVLTAPGGVANGTSYATDYANFGQSTTGTVQEGRRYWLSATYNF